MKTGSKWNWSMLFTAILLLASYIGETAMASSARLPHGYALSSVVGLQFAAIAGGICLVVVCAYSIFTKQSASLIGFVIAVAAFPVLGIANFLAADLAQPCIGQILFKTTKYNPSSPLRLILPFIFLVLSVTLKPRKNIKISQQFPACDSSPSAAPGSST